MDEQLKLLIKLDERTKFIKETLEGHCDDQKSHATDIATLKNNIAWIKRIGIGGTSLTAIATGLWKVIT